MNTAEILLDVI